MLKMSETATDDDVKTIQDVVAVTTDLMTGGMNKQQAHIWRL